MRLRRIFLLVLLALTMSSCVKREPVLRDLTDAELACLYPPESGVPAWAQPCEFGPEAK